MRADMANTNLAKEKLRREMDDQQKVLDEKNALLETVTKEEEEWKKLSDLLQSQLDQKSEEAANTEEELICSKSRLQIYKNELEEKEEQLEVLQETINQLKQTKKSRASAEREESPAG